MQKEIKVAICDDAYFLCEGFKEQLNIENFFFAGMAHSAKECIELVKSTPIDVLLLDIRMETECAGIEVIPMIKEINDKLKIIMLTGYNDDNYIFDAFASGADDYCLKETPIKQISEKIKNVYNGVSALSPNIQQTLLKKTREMYNNNQSILLMYSRISSLTAGEFELLYDLYYGDTYETIAKKRSVETDSVRKMGNRLHMKFGELTINDLVLQLKQLKFFDTIPKIKK